LRDGAAVSGRLEAALISITTLAVDAVVNAANSSLLGGGGVDGANHRAAGPGLLDECRRIGRCPTGQARLTGGYRLPARHVIHTVGPVWQGGNKGEPDLLASCYRNSLAIAAEQAFAVIAFPAISCGAYRYPIAAAAAIAVREVRDFLADHDRPERVIFACTDAAVFEAYTKVLEQ